ncbi:hypothetical protein KHQ86_gp159 [Gordonia phage Stormageddon]|uniref:Uncharacterized protein n=1 Tax=Gordonia phage Stormageddon TaxID=2656541 RepID=A0A649VRX4_9CAUD|nr:hypothetical protein KHQ86_gp159 [Gordonia phage Stormageddon]QGJ95001.1 hypothetical protein SEA_STORMAGEDDON_141 [Gordonia phage Stormageddon]
MAQTRRVCARCGRERAEKHLERLFTARPWGLTQTRILPTSVWVCYARTSCKQIAKGERRAARV